MIRKQFFFKKKKTLTHTLYANFYKKETQGRHVLYLINILFHYYKFTSLSAIESV